MKKATIKKNPKRNTTEEANQKETAIVKHTPIKAEKEAKKILSDYIEDRVRTWACYHVEDNKKFLNCILQRKSVKFFDFHDLTGLNWPIHLLLSIFDFIISKFPRFQKPKKEELIALSEKEFTLDDLVDFAYNHLTEQDKHYPKWMRHQTKDIPNRYSVVKTDKPRSYIRDMIRRDTKSCIEKDKKLAKAGIQKPKRDIYKDDPCYGCKFAKDNRDSNMGPFDRRFHCEGCSRFTNQLGEAVSFIGEAASSKDERTRIKFLLQAQRTMLYAAMIIGERVENGRLECVQTSGKPSCFIGAELSEYLQASSKDVRRV